MDKRIWQISLGFCSTIFSGQSWSANVAVAVPTEITRAMLAELGTTGEVQAEITQAMAAECDKKRLVHLVAGCDFVTRLRECESVRSESSGSVTPADLLEHWRRTALGNAIVIREAHEKLLQAEANCNSLRAQIAINARRIRELEDFMASSQNVRNFRILEQQNRELAKGHTTTLMQLGRTIREKDALFHKTASDYEKLLKEKNAELALFTKIRAMDDALVGCRKAVVMCDATTQVGTRSARRKRSDVAMQTGPELVGRLGIAHFERRQVRLTKLAAALTSKCSVTPVVIDASAAPVDASTVVVPAGRVQRPRSKSLAEESCGYEIGFMQPTGDYAFRRTGKHAGYLAQLN